MNELSHLTRRHYERNEGITRRERTRRNRDWRVHLNPATLVTPTFQCPVLIYLMTKNQHVSRTAHRISLAVKNQL